MDYKRKINIINNVFHFLKPIFINSFIKFNHGDNYEKEQSID